MAEKWVHREGNVYFSKTGKLFIGDLIIANLYQDNEEWVAAVWQNDNVGLQKSRGSLIAAAPQLLEALKLVSQLLRLHVGNLYEPENFALAKAEAAISAAKGDS